MNKEHEAKKYTLEVFSHKTSVYDFGPEMILNAFLAGWNKKEESMKQDMETVYAEINALLKP